MKLDIAVNGYLAYRANAYSASTLRNDAKALKRLVDYFGPVKIETISPLLMDEYLRNKTISSYSPSTYNTTLTLLRGFFRYCRQFKLAGPDFDPLVGQRNKPVPPAARVRIPLARFPELLDAPATRRDRIIIAIGLYLAVRESELRAIRIKDVSLDERKILIHVQKSNRIDRKPISPEFDAELRSWLTYYSKVCGNLDPEWFLVPQFTPATGWDVRTLNPTRGLAPQGAGRAVKAAVRALGYPDKGVGMHTLRRSAAAAMHSELTNMGFDGSLRTVASMLNHKSQKTTEIYIGTEIDQHTRDRVFTDGPMYPSLQADNVTRLEDRHGRDTDQAM